MTNVICLVTYGLMKTYVTTLRKPLSAGTNIIHSHYNRYYADFWQVAINEKGNKFTGEIVKVYL